MAPPITVYIIGATGRTGSTIVDALLEKASDFKITAAIRPSSSDKPAVAALRARGVELHIIDLASSSHDQLVEEFRGVNAVLSTIIDFQLQKPLAKAAKEAGVTRFVPSDWATACVRGPLRIHDMKADIQDYIKEIGLGFTFIDVGWWSQNIGLLVNPAKSYIPPLNPYFQTIWGTGDVKTAITDIRDIGPFVARILADERTLNQYVFAWAEEFTLNEAIALAEKVLEKKLELPHESAEDLEQRVQNAEGMMVHIFQYLRSVWIRGDNTIENAKRPEYGGALDARKLYPEFKPRTLEQLMQEYVADLKEEK